MTEPLSITEVNERLKAVAKHDWCHRVELDASAEFTPAENLRYRFGMMRELFSSLCRGRSVLVLNETSGVYPTLLTRCGASAVTANHAGRANVELMGELQTATGQPFEIVPQTLLTFNEGQVLVDLERAGQFGIVFAQNLIWGLYNASGQRFEDIVEGLAHYASDGLILDWTDAKWATPPPPPEYSRANLLAALRERFEFVVTCTDWLILALGKLPTDGTTTGDGR